MTELSDKIISLFIGIPIFLIWLPIFLFVRVVYGRKSAAKMLGITDVEDSYLKIDGE